MTRGGRRWTKGNGNEPLVVQISLISDEHDDDIRPTLVTDVVDPFGSVEEGCTI
jgi:hypothetical protein